MKGCWLEFLRLCMMIFSRIIQKCVWSVRRVGMSLGTQELCPSPDVTTKGESLPEGSHRTISPSPYSLPWLWRCLFLLQSWGCCLTTEQGIKWAGLQFACSATGLLPVTIWPSNCLQRAAAGTEGAGTKGNFKTQPSWPQEKLHAAVDAVWLPVPLQQDLGNLCTPQGFNRAAQQSGHRAHLQPPYTAHCSGEDLCSIIGPLSFRKGLTAWSKSSADIYIDFCGHHTQVLHIFWKYIKKDWHPGAALLNSSWGEKKSDHFPGTILR